MRAEQLRNHSCDEKDCPGARRLHQGCSGGVLTPSTPTSCCSEVTSSFCRHCDVIQGLTADCGSTVTLAGGGSGDASLAAGQTTATTLTGQLLSRLYLGTLPFSNYCRI